MVVLVYSTSAHDNKGETGPVQPKAAPQAVATPERSNASAANTTTIALPTVAPANGTRFHFVNLCTHPIDLLEKPTHAPRSTCRLEVGATGCPGNSSGTYHHATPGGRINEATLFEVTFTATMAFYDISIVPPGCPGSAKSLDECKQITSTIGFNIPMEVQPSDASCKRPKCSADTCADAYLFPNDVKTLACPGSSIQVPYPPTVRMTRRGQVQCCAFVSVAGVVFLSSLGGVLHLQPEYIRGLTHATSPEKLAVNCWIGAAMYAVAWAICLVALMIQARHDATLKKKSYDLQDLRRTLSSWEDLGMPPRLDRHDVMPPDHDDFDGHHDDEGTVQKAE